MDNLDITSDGLPSDAHVTSEDSGEASQGVASLSLDELQQTLGKKFPTKEAALKSIKDTYTKVVQNTDDVTRKVLSEVEQRIPKTDSLAQELSELKKNLFYKDNPDYVPYRSLIDSLGTNPADVVVKDEFKSVFEKAKGYDESQKLRTVLESSPRIAASKDNLQKAGEAFQAGKRGDVAELVTKAVREAYGF